MSRSHVCQICTSPASTERRLPIEPAWSPAMSSPVRGSEWSGHCIRMSFRQAAIAPRPHLCHKRSSNCVCCASDASKEFQAEQVQSFLHSLDGGEGPSWQDDRKYEEFIRPPQPQGPQHQAWVDEYGRLPAARAAAPFPSHGDAAGPSAEWANEYQV